MQFKTMMKKMKKTMKKKMRMTVVDHMAYVGEPEPSRLHAVHMEENDQQRIDLVLLILRLTRMLVAMLNITASVSRAFFTLCFTVYAVSQMQNVFWS